MNKNVYSPASILLGSSTDLSLSFTGVIPTKDVLMALGDVKRSLAEVREPVCLHPFKTGYAIKISNLKTGSISQSNRVLNPQQANR